MEKQEERGKEENLMKRIRKEIEDSGWERGRRRGE